MSWSAVTLTKSPVMEYLKTPKAMQQPGQRIQLPRKTAKKETVGFKNVNKQCYWMTGGVLELTFFVEVQEDNRHFYTVI